jgi:hypothetical protein
VHHSFAGGDRLPTGSACHSAGGRSNSYLLTNSGDPENDAKFTKVLNDMHAKGWKLHSVGTVGIVFYK